MKYLKAAVYRLRFDKRFPVLTHHGKLKFNDKIMRIDKFLKVSRILKRRTLSKEACEKGKVYVNGREAKAGCQIKAGDVAELHFTGGTVKFRILQIKETVKKDEASSLYEIIE